MTVEELRASGCLLFESISGSRAYNLHGPQSDTDVRGVFILPLEERLRWEPLSQIASERNDEVYWELDKFLALLAKANPSALELLYSSPECVRVRHPLMDRIASASFLTLECQDSFAGYALGQIKKARGLNKKIVNPQPEQRLGVLDFCKVTEAGRSVELVRWLKEQGLRQEQCGLSALVGMSDLYALYVDRSDSGLLQGLVRPESHEVCLSAIPQGWVPVAYLSWNKNAYAHHCREHKEYWDWVALRNQERFQGTQAHGKNYDAKNMMHTFRLLHMAREILSGQGVQVQRTHDREELLRIKAGAYDYVDLLSRAEGLVQEISLLATHSPLPPKSDRESAEQLAIELRREWYGI